MNDIAPRINGNITPFHPHEFKTQQAKLEALIAYAIEVKDWPLLEEAVSAKVEQQGQFVTWWETNVHRKGGERWVDRQDQGDQELSMREAEDSAGIRHQQVSRWIKSLEKPEQYREQLRLAAYRKAGLEPEENHRAEGTGENEWFTPTQYIEAARRVMGGIDLDPASHAIAQQTVQAAHYFTRQDNGLNLSWYGRVWLNPPYAQPYIAQFVAKLVGEFVPGGVEQAILLTHNYTDTTWFHQAEAGASLLCFTRGRIRFVDVDGGVCAPTQGQSFFYFGPNVDAFREVFGAFGFVR